MKRELSILTVGVITFNLILACHTRAPGQCKSLYISDNFKLSKGQSLSIRLFSIKSPFLYRIDTGEPFYKAEPLENLRISLAENLRDQLLQLKHFGSIVILPDDQAPQTDLVLEGEFTTIYQLGGKIQLIAYPVTRMGVKGSIDKRDTLQKVIEFTCHNVSEAGFINRPKKQMHKNIEKIAERMKRLVGYEVWYAN